MQMVRKTLLCSFYSFLGRALPSLAHLPAKGLKTLWTPIICRLRRLIIIFLLLLLIFMTLYMKGKEKNEQADVRK